MPKTEFDHICDDLRTFFAAGQGHTAAQTLERFVVHLIGRELANLAESKVPILTPLIELAEGKAEKIADGATDAALSHLAPKPTEAGTSTVTEIPNAAPSVAVSALRAAPAVAPSHVFTVPEGFRATFDALPPDAKRAYIAAHASL